MIQMNEDIESRLEKEYERLIIKNEEFMGYPLACDFNYETLAPFLNMQINNIGDPFLPSSLGIDTKQIEREVVYFFMHLLRAKKEETWGYITNGGSEGNLYGLYLAREVHPNGMVYYSESTHYSVQKNLHLLRVPNIVIRAQENGEMDYDDLEQTLIQKRDQPAIFFLNIGTTMTEAIDQLKNIKAIIKRLAIKEYYIHCDGALSGIMVPFYKNKPEFDFADGIDSISISGHKFIGSPIPCGIVLVKNEYKNRVGKSISYVATKDTTITGSRNGLSPLIMWMALKSMKLSGLKNRVVECQNLAEYTLKQLNKKGYNAWKNPEAITVVFNRPSDEMCKKYQLASEGDRSHIICMPGFTKERVDRFIEELPYYEPQLEYSFAEVEELDSAFGSWFS